MLCNRYICSSNPHNLVGYLLPSTDETGLRPHLDFLPPGASYPISDTASPLYPGLTVQILPNFCLQIKRSVSTSPLSSPPLSTIWPLHYYSQTIHKSRLCFANPSKPMEISSALSAAAVRSRICVTPSMSQVAASEGGERQSKAPSCSRCLINCSEPAWSWLPSPAHSLTHSLSLTLPLFLRLDHEGNLQDRNSPQRTFSKCICKMHQSILIKMFAECQQKL